VKTEAHFKSCRPRWKWGDNGDRVNYGAWVVCLSARV